MSAHAESAARAVVATLGAGRMGRGIAQAFAYGGHDVWLIDYKPRSAAELSALRAAALAEIDGSLRALVELGVCAEADRLRVMQRIRFAGRDEAPAALHTAAVVFEAVPEVFAAKREALAFADARTDPRTIIASTTSTFLVSTLAGFVAGSSRFLNAHWLNPAYIVPLVELSPHAATAPDVLASLRQLLTELGKVPVVCASAPGYIVPRLQALIMSEAARMIEEGVASPRDIDLATRYGLGLRYAAMGVVEFIDYGGNDTLFYASSYLAAALGPRYEPPAIVKRRMDDGRIGLKTLQGFYDYRGVDEAAYRKDVLARILAMLKHLGLLRPPR
jgi:3-hydroxybutyryl-CoA dehydrogenase